MLRVNLSLVALLMHQEVTLLRVEHLQRATQRLVHHLLGITTLGKFFAEKVEAGKPEDFRVAAQPLIPSAPLGSKEPTSTSATASAGRKKSKPRAVKYSPSQSPRRGGVKRPRLQDLCLTSYFPSTGANSRGTEGIFSCQTGRPVPPAKSALVRQYEVTIRYPIPCVNHSKVTFLLREMPVSG